MSLTINTNVNSLNAQRALGMSCVSTPPRTTPPAWRSPTG